MSRRDPLHRLPPARAIRAVVLAAALLACGGPATAQEAGDGLLVLAASSLTDVLPGVGRAWEARGGVPVRFSFDATSRLAPQVVQGVPADALVSADARWMEWLRERGAVDEASLRTLARNELVVAVPRGAPRPRDQADLAAMARVAVAGENVPAGRYAAEALEAGGVWDALGGRLVRGGSVRGVLEWVARAEVDAGVVYRTDALGEPRVEVAFAFPAAAHRPIVYPAAVLARTPRAGSARAFLDFAAGPEGRALFREAGFLPGGQGPVQAGGEGASARAPGPSSAPDPWAAVRLSVLVALLATAVGLLPAVGLGWLLARHEFRGKTLVSTLVLSPLVVPPVVTGFLLLTVFGARSPVGRALSAFGVSIPFTLIGAALAALVVGLPLYVLSVRGAFVAVDRHYEELSWTLGVPPRRTFLRVSLPLALPGIAAGAVLAFARALGEFGATVVLAGNVEGSTRTIALAVYTLLESPSGQRATWVLVGASVVLSLAALAGYEALSRRQRSRVEDPGGH